MAEFSCMEDLVSTTQTVEDAMHYDLGTQQVEGQGGNRVTPQRPVPMGVWSNAIPRLPLSQNVQSRTTLNNSST